MQCGRSCFPGSPSQRCGDAMICPDCHLCINRECIPDFVSERCSGALRVNQSGLLCSGTPCPDCFTFTSPSCACSMKDAGLAGAWRGAARGTRSARGRRSSSPSPSPSPASPSASSAAARPARPATPATRTRVDLLLGTNQLHPHFGVAKWSGFFSRLTVTRRSSWRRLEGRSYSRPSKQAPTPSPRL